MADASEGGKSSGPLQTILIAVVVALLTGSSAPFWWPSLFPGHAKSATTDPPPAATGLLAGGQGPAAPPSTPKSSMSAIMRRTNLSGGDIDNYGFDTTTEDQCSDLCLKNDTCKAMTFVHHPNGAGGVCWLKNTVPASSSDLNMDSAVKLSPQ